MGSEMAPTGSDRNQARCPARIAANSRAVRDTQIVPWESTELFKKGGSR